jgi:hypothetical protein
LRARLEFPDRLGIHLLDRIALRSEIVELDFEPVDGIEEVRASVTSGTYSATATCIGIVRKREMKEMFGRE